MTGVESTGLLKRAVGEIRENALDLVITSSVCLRDSLPHHSLIVKTNNP